MSELVSMNRYEVGSIVWAKVFGYPWWPAMVDHDPDIMDYIFTKEGTEHPTHYHVVFFGDDVSRSWVEPNKMKPFVDSKTLKEMGPFVVKGKDYRQIVKRAIVEAMDALEMTIEDRLEKYSFLHRYKGEEKVGKHQASDIIGEEGRKRKRGDANLSDESMGIVNNEQCVRLYASIKGILDDVEKILDSTDDLDSIYDDPDFTDITIDSSQKSEDDEFEMKSKRKKRGKNTKEKKKTTTTPEKTDPKEGRRSRKRKVVAKDVTEKENVQGTEKENGEKAKRKRGRPQKMMEEEENKNDNVVIREIETKETDHLKKKKKNGTKPKPVGNVEKKKEFVTSGKKEANKIKPTFKSNKKVDKPKEEEVEVLIFKEEDGVEKVDSSSSKIIHFEE